MKKKIIILLLFAICLTGCGSSKAMKVDDFKNSMNDKKFMISETIDSFSEKDKVVNGYVATSENQLYKINYLLFDDKEDAMKFFYKYKENAMERKIPSSSETSDNNKYTLTTDGQYLVISRIDNSILYLDVDSVYKSEVKDIVDELGY